MKKTYRIEVDCANCANLMEDAANKIEGVAGAVVNYMTQKMVVEFAEGIGDVLMPASGPGDNMKGYYIVVVKRDDIAVSTKDAYAAITPKKPAKCCRDIVRQPIETWKDELVNDFEAPIFAMHPELAEIKQKPQRERVRL